MLSHSNLTRLARLHQEHDRDLVQEYLDSLLSVEAFEPLEENKVEGIADSNTAVRKPKGRSRQSKRAKSQTAPPSDKSRPAENNKPSSTRRRREPNPPRQHKHDALNHYAVRAELDETDPTSKAINGQASPADVTQYGEVATKRMPKPKTRRATEQSKAVEQKTQELDVVDTEPTLARNKSRNGRKVKQRSRCKQHAQGQGQGPGKGRGQGQGQGQEQGAMTEQPQNEPRSSRNFEVHALTEKTEGTLLSPRKNAPTAARTGYRNWHKKPNGRKRRGDSSRGGKGKSCSLEAGSVSMRQIANEDKGQTRFAPKLKARPNRNRTAPSEDGTPAPTPSLSGSDAGSFGASLLEADAGLSNATASSSVGAAGKDLSSRRLSAVSTPAAATPMSPPPTLTRPIATPKSPTFSPTKLHKDKSTHQGTAISFPSVSDKSASEASSSTSTAAGKPIVVGSSKPAKGASIISVPTARTQTERDEEDEVETPESSTSSRKRSKGKQVVRNRTRESSHMEDGEDLTEDGDDEVPDYSDTYMHEFTKDMGTGRRSKTPGPAEDEVDELAEDYEEQVAIKQDEKEAEAKREPSVPAQQLMSKTLAPQVRVVDGRIELDHDSLVVDHDIVDAVVDQGPMEYVEESALTKFVNSSSYSTKPKSEKWSEEDTDRFYEAISQWGTDFGIIFRLFPGKSRIGVRNKFKREDRLNHQRVEEALNRRAGMDLKEYSQVTNQKFPEVDEATMFKKKPEDEEDLLPDLSFADEYRDDGEELEGVEKEEEPQDEETEEIVGMVDG
ncbi:Transcription factor TFIIIB component B [Mortierella alpina]|uniref:Transcription factor TFIIIB component B n=1 Tax=Mortierella alpina TaxID=64518 RepID=A0A9P6JDL6_MORAP|nr:Transcription factor TFIIIB component B [Mortierella alpina]